MPKFTRAEVRLPGYNLYRISHTTWVNANAYGSLMSDIALDKDQIEWKIWYDNSLNILWIDVCHYKACMIDSVLHTVCTVSTHWILHLSSPPFWRRPRKLEIRYQPLPIIFHHLSHFIFQQKFGITENFIISLNVKILNSTSMNITEETSWMNTQYWAKIGIGIFGCVTR